MSHSKPRSTAVQPSIAYFSMEVGLEPSMPTYSGGLGVLAGDTLKSAADLGLPLIGVTLLHRKGYFRQHLDEQGHQQESPAEWNPEDFLELLTPVVTVPIEGRNVQVRAWLYRVQGTSGRTVPVYFLDTRWPENDTYDQSLTDTLYGGDSFYRLCQETILGIGGVAILRALGHENLRIYHMNEGHSALLSLALLEDEMEERGIGVVDEDTVEAVRHRCVFTTHTPVPAGHDQFSLDMATQALGQVQIDRLLASGFQANGNLNMTHLALHFSRYINGVAMRHGQVSRDMFPNYPIGSITNGVHALTWVVPPLAQLYDRYFPEWRRDTLYLRHAISVSLEEFRDAHMEAKRALLDEIEGATGTKLDPELFTIGFARRATTYKRADLVFSDIDRLRSIVRRVGPLQIVYAGKAHPKDDEGKAVIEHIYKASQSLENTLRVVYLEDYDMHLGKVLCGGVDLWLNTPRKPQEASGTSGMKAAINGVPSLSILDGWWIEGYFEGVTGWSIGDEARESDDEREATSLYHKLENVVMPLFYRDPLGYARVMRAATALNGSYFSAQRMMVQYVRNAYRPADPVQLAVLLRNA
jgi:starch phosphorylase